MSWWAKLREMFKSRYMTLLEQRVRELTIERDAALIREQDAIATMLAHIGAPMIPRHTGKVEFTPSTGGVKVPSQWRAEREQAARDRMEKKTKQEA